MPTNTDFTAGGTKIEGAYENDRNAAGADLFKAIIREVYGVQDVIIAHHLVFVTEERGADGFMYQIVEEIPAADTLIFDHDIARRLWGVAWPDKLMQLALEPPETRDKLLAQLLQNRSGSLA